MSDEFLKTHLSLLKRKYVDGYCFLYEAFLQLKREMSLFYQVTFIQKFSLWSLYSNAKSSMITLMFNLNFKLYWMYFTNIPFRFSTIIYTADIINEVFCWVEMSSLDFIRRNHSWYEFKKHLAQNKVLGQFPLECMPIAWYINLEYHVKEMPLYVYYKYFIFYILYIS